jgi:hypothetical protein
MEEMKEEEASEIAKKRKAQEAPLSGYIIRPCQAR